MDEPVIKNKLLNGIKVFFSIFIVIFLYILFRFTIGEKIINYTSPVFGQRNISLTSNALSPLSLPEAGIYDQKSHLPSIDYQSRYLGVSNIESSDPKILAMRKFLIDYNSPMYLYADVFVNQAQRYGLDWRLVASISGVESAFGNITPRGTNNAWGWKGGPGGDFSIFENFGEGVKVITRGLALGYGTTLTPFEIERAYCPPCYANPYHAWANGVTKFMNELDYYLKNLENI